jgi:hypothetical protein
MWSHGETPCFDGWDVSGGERVQIDDTVALLLHIFTAEGFDILAPAPASASRRARASALRRTACTRGDTRSLLLRTEREAP